MLRQHKKSCLQKEWCKLKEQEIHSKCQILSEKRSDLKNSAFQSKMTGHSYALLLLNGKWVFSPDYSGTTELDLW